GACEHLGDGRAHGLHPASVFTGVARGVHRRIAARFLGAARGAGVSGHAYSRTWTRGAGCDDRELPADAALLPSSRGMGARAACDRHALSSHDMELGVTLLPSRAGALEGSRLRVTRRA